MQHPLPTPDELKAYYEGSYEDGMYTEFAAAVEMKRMTAQRRIFEIRRRLPIAGEWLDVGCGDGMFVKVASEHGATAAGVELSDVAVQLGKHSGLDVHCGTLDSLPDTWKYDTITGFDVIEHVLQPAEFLRDIHARLKDGGHVVLTLPDMDSIVRRVMGSRWYFYIPEEHLHYFNRTNLGQLLKQEGFEVTSATRTYKPLTFNYSLTQFAEYNPGIYRVLSTAGKVIPDRMRSKIIPLPIGEMMLVARKISRAV
ncbi:class I SAM-dependent methyltransferase [Rubripirellula tenax]|nr:class I SAM-dependent methyltransferase [Rubripirellula tenax]